jgi:hypothetical protein
MQSKEQMQSDVLHGLRTLHEIHGESAVRRILAEFMKNWRPAQDIYRPSPQLQSRISDYERWHLAVNGVPHSERYKYTTENVGQLLEEITFLAFRSIVAETTIKAYESYSAQLDLVVSSTDFNWLTFFTFIGLDTSARTIVVEVKNTDGKVEDKQFGRFCGLLHMVFANSAQLGIIVSRNGATGFPVRGQKRRTKGLTAAQATQILFYAKTNKVVVVLDDADIRRLGEPGMLPLLLEAKIRTIEEWTGLPTKLDETGKEMNDLPVHLKKYELSD